MTVKGEKALREEIQFGSFTAGVPSTSAILFRYLATEAIDFPADVVGTIGHAGTAPSSQTDFDVQKNGVSVATLRFAASGTTLTSVTSTAFSLAATDRLDIVSPGAVNAIADVTFTLVGKAGT